MSILFDGRFSKGALFSNYALLEVGNQNVVSSTAPYGVGDILTIVADPLGSGDLVARHFLDRRTDPLVKRCEIDSPSDAIGTTRWYYNRILLDPAWIKDPIGVSEIIAQIHDRPDGGDPEREPPFSIRVENDQFQIVRTHETVGNTSRVVIDWSGKLEPGRWIDWVYRINWQYNGTGSLHVWKDARPIVAMPSVSTCFNDFLPLYAKVGPYKYLHLNTPLTTRLIHNGGTVIGSGAFAAYNDFAKAIGLENERERLAVYAGSVSF